MRLFRLLPAALLVLGLSWLGAAPARAAVLVPFTETHFTEQQFKAAQAKGEPILVEIFATWCPTCAQQKPIIDRLAATPQFKGLVILRVDFDSQKDVVRAFGARMQSTLVVFHGADLRGVTVGETDPAAIKALLAKSLS
ncbi:MAG: thioredoxin family protein [Rhodospirillales bacterium]|nr:thioredoxin family protein [Rhodospirillales bacterium]MDE2576743.1 thioredoxin family protein [Rhodospirillales bacterium]